MTLSQPSQPCHSQATGDGWQARLELGFRPGPGRTLLAHRRHQGPLQVQRPFYPEADGACHVTVLHPPGGVVGGDGLVLDAELATGSRALLTTPAAGKFYRSAGPTAHQTQTLRVAPGAVLEWLPQETIVYRGARVRSLTRVELAGTAGFLGWEITCLGRPAAGERFTAGVWDQRFELWRDGEPVYLERGLYAGGAPILDAAWGLGGRPVTATLICAGGDADLTPVLREALAPPATGELLSASALDGVLVCRYLGPSAARARAAFLRAWGVLRPALWGKPACPPRIWFT